ncbi:hypothetical protein [Nocardia bovistercoris]|uniref:Uncharacterized protein n=1 Tax=Nocardia bovistercoris TaxID=2785916 RepID=A0A931IA86_9NOCA|nr:hypothetical protein [Nocardia bovistercoris]MBH0776163.1 hypothetical protein [Nocardia bovistercoris]
MTPEQEAVLRDIQAQLRGPDLTGWPQLGADADGHDRSLVDGVAAALRRIEELEGQAAALRGQVVELRTEISELEVTAADLAEEVRRLEERRLPWPLSLLEGPVEFLGTQLNRLEGLLPELPGVPGRDSAAREKPSTVWPKG